MRWRWLLLLLLPTLAQAQTPVTATSGVSFGSSADHVGTNADGSPIVARYEVRFQPSTGCAAVAPVDVAKPAPTAGVITAKPLSAMASLPANCIYTFSVAAIGPGGEGVSGLSAPFVRYVLLVPRAPTAPVVVP